MTITKRSTRNLSFLLLLLLFITFTTIITVINCSTPTTQTTTQTTTTTSTATSTATTTASTSASTLNVENKNNKIKIQEENEEIFETISFLECLNFLQRTDLFHPLLDKDNKCKELVLNFSKFILQSFIDNTLQKDTNVDNNSLQQNRSEILQLISLTSEELEKIHKIFNETENLIYKKFTMEEIYTKFIKPRKPESDEETLQERILRFKNFLISILSIHKTQYFNFYNLYHLNTLQNTLQQNTQPIENNHLQQFTQNTLQENNLNNFYKKLNLQNPLKFITIGSGPIGLLTTLESALTLPRVLLIEKRKDLTRDVWFDLYSKPYSQAVEILSEIGFLNEFPEIELKVSEVYGNDGEEKPTYTIRCQLTQRFITKVLYLLENVKFVYGNSYVTQCVVKNTQKNTQNIFNMWSDVINSDYNNDYKNVDKNVDNSDGEHGVILLLKSSSNKKCQNYIDYLSQQEVLNLCQSTNQQVITLPSQSQDYNTNHEINHVNNNQCEFERIAFDILIGADGLYSNVRSSLNISTHDIHTFDLSQTIFRDQYKNEKLIPKITVKPKLNQVALIINFKKGNDGECPDTAIDPDTGDFIDPWKPGFLLENVRSIFKRFYAGHCHMQILFDYEYGEKIITKYMNAREKALQKLLQKMSQNNLSKQNNERMKSVILDAEAREIRSAAFADTTREYDLFGSGSHTNFTQNNVTSLQKVDNTLQKTLQNNLQKGDNWEDEAFEWERILEIVNTVLGNPYPNVEEFKEAIVQHPNLENNGKELSKRYDMILLRVVLQKANQLTHITTLQQPLDNSMSQLNDNLSQNSKNRIYNNRRPYTLTILKGDSVASAHFRLGVGVNNAYLAFGEITQLIKDIILNERNLLNNLLNKENLNDKEINKENINKENINDIKMEILKTSLNEYEKKANYRWTRLINYMATAMYFESYCDLVVFINPGEYFGIQTIQEKDYENRDYFPFDSLMQVKRFCQRFDKQSVWWN
ncbi:hypothetical protein ABK040_003814 [Willaertia magna]